jgi:hypothetical protein
MKKISFCFLLPLLVVCMGTGCDKKPVSLTASPPLSTEKSQEPTQPIVESPIRFTDVARKSGLAFRWSHQGKTPLTILETAGCGGAFLDYDGDGWLDIFLVGQPQCALYRNKQDGTFEDVTQQAGITTEGYFMGVAVGDVDNDGRPDVFVTGYGKNVFYRNRGGKFTDETQSAGLSATGPYAWSTSATFTDLNNDGFLDVAIGHYVTFTPDTLQTCDFSGVQASCPPFYYEKQFLRVLQGNGKGGFQEATKAWGMDKGHGYNLGVAATDYDGDGWQDLYVANDGLPADLWRNRGGRSFQNVGELTGTSYNDEGSTQAGMGVDWGDYDNDSLPDLVVTTFQDEPKALYHNEGGGLFRFTSYQAGIGNATLNRLGFGVVLEDLDGDGWRDLVTANGHVQDTVEKYRAPAAYKQTLQCFHNQQGRFTEVTEGAGTAFSEKIVGRGIAVGDYDNDGRPDLLIINLEGFPLLLHNESSPQSWIGVRVVPKTGNRDGIGTKITVKSDSLTQTREVQTGRSYLSASDTRQIFGLGNANQVSEVRVRWNSGKTELFSVKTVNQWVTLTEGTGVTP